ncbi:MAG TPA: hypothetical protein VFT90_00225, partial [Chryseosolibacter sp.]|nr:hypothetical protein [Chryseosolibacter sp.]
PLFYLILMVAIASCAARNSHDHEHHSADESTWEELDSFHLIMAESFHPFRDSANLEPAKARASALMAAASDWASAPLPEKVNNDTMRSRLEQLREQAATLAQSVKSQDDNAIGEMLTKLHDTFHEIEHAWYEED